MDSVAALTKMGELDKTISLKSQLCTRNPATWTHSSAAVGHSRRKDTGLDACTVTTLLAEIIQRGLKNVDPVKCGVAGCPFVFPGEERDEGYTACGAHLCCDRCEEVLPPGQEDEDYCSECIDMIERY